MKSLSFLILILIIAQVADAQPERRKAVISTVTTSEVTNSESSKNYRSLRAKANALYRNSMELTEIRRAVQEHHDYLVSLNAEIRQEFEGEYIDLDLDFLLAVMRMTNLSLHAGSRSEAIETLRRAIEGSETLYSVYVRNLSTYEKGIILFNIWRSIDVQLGVPEWESENIEVMMLELVRLLKD